MPFEYAFLVLTLALLSTLNAFFSSARWISFVCLSFAVLGVTGLVEISPAFDLYFAFGPSSVILFIVAAVYARPFQRLLLAVTGTLLLFGLNYVHQTEAFYEKSTALLGLFGFSMLFPVFLGRLNDDDAERVERLITLQQLWIRICFLNWCRENAVNLQHYDFLADSILPLTVVAALILAVGVGLRPRSWFFSAKAFVSLGLFVGALGIDKSGFPMLLLWVLLLGFLNLLPNIEDRRIQTLVRRLGLGAFGGIASFGLLFIFEQVPLAPLWKLVWCFMIFVLGFFVYILPGRHERDAEAGPFVQTIGLALQVVFLLAVLNWSELKHIGS
jgi:hypothetical protein